MPREYSRHLRVGSELQRILNDLLQSEVKDPRLRDVRVSGVDLSGDLGVARVYYSMLNPDADTRPVEAAFRKALGFIRARVGREARLRRVPELRFEPDDSARHGFEISRLIDSSVSSSGSSDALNDDESED